MLSYFQSKRKKILLFIVFTIIKIAIYALFFA
jgi:hypothetical protein